MALLTIKKLKELLELFPEDILIMNELEFKWEYPETLKNEEENMNNEEFQLLTIANAKWLELISQELPEKE